MPPEEAFGVVYLDAMVRDGRLRVQPTRIDLTEGRSAGPPLRVLWYEQPNPHNRADYWILGEDVAFVRRDGAYRSPEPMNEIDFPMQGNSYAWADYAEAIIVVLPRGSTLALQGTVPQAKVAYGDRIALLWKPGPVTFDLRALGRTAVADGARRINSAYGSAADTNRRGERDYIARDQRPLRESAWRSFIDFWAAVPDVLKAVTGFLVALVSLVTILNATGVCGPGHTDTGTQTPTAGKPVLDLVPKITLSFNTHNMNEFPVSASETVSNTGGGQLRLDTPPRVEGPGFSLLSTSTCYFSKSVLANRDYCFVTMQFIPPSGPGQYVGRLTVADSLDGLTQSVDLRAIAR